MKFFETNNYKTPIYWDLEADCPKQPEGFNANDGENISLSDHHHYELIKIVSPIIRLGKVSLELIDRNDRFFDKKSYNRVLKAYQNHLEEFGGSININDWVRQEGKIGDVNKQVLTDHFIFPKVKASDSFLLKLCRAITRLKEAMDSKISGRYPKDIEATFNRSLRYINNPITFQFGSGGQDWIQRFNNELLWAWFCMLNEKWGSDIKLCENPNCNKPIVGKRKGAKTCSDYCRVQRHLQLKGE